MRDPCEYCNGTGAKLPYEERLQTTGFRAGVDHAMKNLEVNARIWNRMRRAVGWAWFWRKKATAGAADMAEGERAPRTTDHIEVFHDLSDWCARGRKHPLSIRCAPRAAAPSPGPETSLADARAVLAEIAEKNAGGAERAEPEPTGIGVPHNFEDDPACKHCGLTPYEVEDSIGECQGRGSLPRSSPPTLHTKAT